MELFETTKLSITQIAQLTGIVLERAQPRSADKPKAVAKFCAALQERIGDKSVALADKVMLSDSCEDALKLLKDELVKHDRMHGKPTSRLENTTINGGRKPNTAQPNQKVEDKMLDNTENTEQKSGRGRKSELVGKTLTCTKEANVRREGSHGHKSLQIIIDNPGITTEAFVEAGGRLVDLKWDIAHGNVAAA